MLPVVQPMDLVDAVGVEHGSVVRQRRLEHQTDVLFKTLARL
jgi:hypothetical protein